MYLSMVMLSESSKTKKVYIVKIYSNRKQINSFWLGREENWTTGWGGSKEGIQRGIR